MGLTIGSEEHKRLLCGFFMESFKKFEPEDLPWPDLDETVRRRLADLPIWEEAVTTEAETALKVQALGRAEKDPLLAEAISLQGYEEDRHARMLRMLTERYGIEVRRKPDLTPPADPHWAFLRVGYGECFDSFFGFGLFALAKDSGYFPPPLVDLFEPVLQEEARHILFIANWVAYCQAQLPSFRRPSYLFRRGLALWLQSVSRVKTAVHLQGAQAARPDQENFTMGAAQSFGDFSVREFLGVCLAEQDRRLAPYDRRLLRPRVVPRLARAALSLAGGRPRPVRAAAGTAL